MSVVGSPIGIRASNASDRSGALYTEFAPPKRAAMEEILRHARHFAGQMLVRQLLDAMPNMVVILNDCRQIVYANAATFSALGIEDRQAILGLSPGELVRCVHAFTHAAGCGTTTFCRKCGAVRAILSAQKGIAYAGECRILQKDGIKIGALDLQIAATPFESAGEGFVIFAVNDISAEKRRRALERIFFHDVLNTASVLRGAIESVADSDQIPQHDLWPTILLLSEQLIDEIQGQQSLAAAEAGELAVNLSTLSSRQVLEQVRCAYTNHDLATGRHIYIAEELPDAEFTSDEVLLSRVIGNMVKNALEASEPGQTVTLDCRMQGSEIEFSVHNDAFMPIDVQLQVFNRSFSTKGTDRGLGTYSVKLLSERYLAGKVSFTSSEKEGTIFRARYPLHLALPD